MSCSALAAAAGESLYGTAPTAEVWWLLEHDGPWAAEPLASPQLEPSLRQTLQRWLTTVPSSRLQLLRQGQARAASWKTPRFWLGVTRRDERWLLSFNLPSWAAWQSIDFLEVLQRRSHPQATPAAAPLWLVCTHGKRDACCAVRGLPVARALAAFDAAHTWQTSHLGGHRFAATLINLPLGICWGRIEPSEVPALHAAALAGRLHDVRRLRGRLGESSVAQAAECLLREREGLVDWQTLRVIGERELEADLWQVELAGEAGRRWQVQLKRCELDQGRPTSCGAELSGGSNYALIDVG